MKKICNYLKFNLGTFLWFETGFRLLLFFLFVAGGGRIVDILLRFQSYSYVTQNNYKKFLCHPVSVIGFLFAGMIILLLILFEVAGLFLLYDAGRKQERIKLGDLWLAAFRTVERFIRRYPFSWYIYIILCLPNIYLQLILWEAERARFLVIVVKDITDVIGIPAFVILLVIYLVSSMMISLALPFRLFGNEKAFGKKLIFHEVLGKNYLNHLHTCFTTHVNVLICSAAAFMSVVLICIHMIWTMRPVNRFVSDALVYGSIIKMITGIITGFLGTVLMLGYMYTVYEETGGVAIPSVVPLSERGRNLALWIAVSISGVILFVTALKYIPNTSVAQDYIEITAHRGGAKYAPENTLAAIAYSIDAKVDYAEIDVQQTADGEIVLLHDIWLGRTTGRRDYIWNLTLDQLKKLDAGSHFSLNFANERIPTLRETLQACKGKIRLNIEIKVNKHNEGIVEKVLQIIQEENFLGNCVITSMDYKTLKEIKELCPEAVTGYTLSMVYGEVRDLDAVDVYSVKKTYVTRELTDTIHSMGKKVYVWTVNNKIDMRKLISCNIDNVITDNPELIRKEIIQEEGYKPDFLSLFIYAIR